MTRLLILTLLAAALAGPALAQRIPADAVCTPTDVPMEYRCEILLGTEESPIDGAVFTVSAAMPSMPMAHNMPPVSAEQAEMPGTYAATVPFEMPGDWTLTLDLSAPRRDRIVIRVVIPAAN